MKRLIIGFLAVFLMFLPLMRGASQDRGISLQQAAGLDSAVGRQWAVFIAINRYKEWPPLTNPVRDAKEIKDILRENFYIDEVRELYDDLATAAGIRQLLVNLRSQAGKDDSVFVFYAGHGHTDLNTNTGSWIPADGGRDEMAQTNWLPNIQVRNMLSQLPAKHVFLISDSCFSGDILDTNRGAAPQISGDYYKRAYSRVSRQVMTSGASETVPDASEFAMRLKNGLKRAEGVCIDPEYLFSTAGVREVKSTQPLLGVIRGSEHQDGGSFLFFRRQTAQTAQPATSTSSQPAAPTPQQPSAPSQPVATGGSVTVNSEIAGEIFIDGQATGRRIKAGGTETINNVSTGSTEVWVKDGNGVTIKAPNVMVRQGQTVTATVKATVQNMSAQPKVVTIKVTGDINNIIASAYTEFFTSRGIRITGGQAYSYLLDVSITLEDVNVPNSNNYKFARYRLNCSLKNKAGEIILSSSESGREGHFTQELAKERAIRSAEQAIHNKDGFMTKFDALLPSLF